VLKLEQVLEPAKMSEFDMLKDQPQELQAPLLHLDLQEVLLGLQDHQGRVQGQEWEVLGRLMLEQA